MPSEASLKLKTLMLRVGDPTGETLESLTAKFGDLTETLAVILDGIETQTDKLAGSDAADSFSYLDAGGEQVMFTIATTTRIKIQGILMDLTALTQDSTIIVWTIVGLAMVEIDRIEWTHGVDAVGVYFAENLAITQNLAITMEEAVDEGADRAIPWSYIIEDME